MKLIRSFVTSAIAITLSACSVPGMYMGVEAVDASGGATDDNISGRADIFPISSQVIAALNSDEITARANRIAGSLKKQDDENYQYLIGPQDVLQITVWDHPELNNPSGVSTPTATGRVVNSDGTLYVPYVGNVKVAGKSVQDVRAFLQSSLVKTFRDPQVDVAILTFKSQRIFISGEVKTPGVQPITDTPTRVADIISIAGGPTVDADLQGATLTRGGKAYYLDLYALFYQGDLSQNLLLQNGDIINLPDRRLRKVFVLGEIDRTSASIARGASVIMPRGNYSLTEALNDAGGVSQVTANASQIYVIRSEESSRPKIFHLSAASPDALLLADRFQLRPRDVIYVDAAQVTRFNRVISQIVPSAQLLQSGKAVVQ